ncbi:uncharacterized protein LOC131648606 [Vicia villosa]|uniref:uncharacterized protein LOC131636856 n=1 Tax=Vicia villosa TaxID=3911 RepID=UPI00273BB261|nr:uncharacterized protein LOC131636856 [Vicia villosa]XP_058774333.1 uncharacterized protein LOC131648606 [Vicia villosa]
MENNGRFHMKKLYLGYLQHVPKVEWKGLLCGDRRITLKDRLAKFGRIDDIDCIFYNGVESLEHILFDCRYTKRIWEDVLSWIKVRHDPLGWNEEITWMIKICNSRNSRGQIVKMAIEEIIHETWWDRNLVVHSIDNSNKNTSKRDIDNIVNSMWGYPKLRGTLAQILML